MIASRVPAAGLLLLACLGRGADPSADPMHNAFAAASRGGLRILAVGDPVTAGPAGADPSPGFWQGMQIAGFFVVDP